MNLIWVILFRWLHVISACLLVGAAFFYAIHAPAMNGQGDGVLAARARRILKMLTRGAIVVLIGAGIYNLLGNWAAYHQNLPLTHALLGTHILLAIIIMALLEIGLSARTSTQAASRFLWFAIALMLLTVAVASSLKFAREHPAHDRARRLLSARISSSPNRVTTNSRSDYVR